MGMKYLTQIVFSLFSSALVATSAFSQSTPENQYFDSEGVRIRYIELGSGEPVIAIHGLTRNSNTWLERVSDLAENHRLILFDQRGHGLSDKPHTVAEYGREMGHDVIRLMDHLDIPKAHILGYSIGVAPIGMVITENESRFISAIFGGGTARWEWGDANDLLNQQIYERIMNSSRQQQLGSSMKDQDQIALASLRLGEKQLVVSKQSISSLSIPILAIVGSEDSALEAVVNFKNTVPAIELVVVEGETHLSLPGHPGFLESIQGFLLRNHEN
jgi:pimeloyl-ACP methyl ester carboxylesterase